MLDQAVLSGSRKRGGKKREVERKTLLVEQKHIGPCRLSEERCINVADSVMQKSL